MASACCDVRPGSASNSAWLARLILTFLVVIAPPNVSLSATARSAQPDADTARGPFAHSDLPRLLRLGGERRGEGEQQGRDDEPRSGHGEPSPQLFERGLEQRSGPPGPGADVPAVGRTGASSGS